MFGGGSFREDEKAIYRVEEGQCTTLVAKASVNCSVNA
jgi:hypothetical protein